MTTFNENIFLQHSFSFKPHYIWTSDIKDLDVLGYFTFPPQLSSLYSKQHWQRRLKRANSIRLSFFCPGCIYTLFDGAVAAWDWWRPDSKFNNLIRIQLVTLFQPFSPTELHINILSVQMHFLNLHHNWVCCKLPRVSYYT